MHKIVIIDDEPNITGTLQVALETSQLRVITAGSAKEGLQRVAEEQPDLVLMDVRLPDMSGLDAFQLIHDENPRLPVVIMTAFSRTETAIEATRRGAFDYQVKPLDLPRLRATIGRALKVSQLNRDPLAPADHGDDPGTTEELLVGQSPEMQEIYKSIGRIAPQDALVLIQGESGTGKELVARAIYNYSLRRDKPFLAVNCAALPEALLESELFGYEKGAFTGAEQRRIGKFEQVNGGTIFLDEIGDMSAATQSKALRLLQQQQFERLGGNTTIQTDVRVITATNRNLAEMVKAGTFRRDLYYRLNGITIRLPPLRERREDIERLAYHFIRLLCRASHRSEPSITPLALDVLRSHDWPGNVRELRSAINFALIYCTTDVITVDQLPESCRASSRHNLPSRPSWPESPESAAQSVATSGATGVSGARTAGEEAAVGTTRAHAESEATVEPEAQADVVEMVNSLLKQGADNIYRRVNAHMDTIMLKIVMDHVHGNKAQAAHLLGVSRMTLRNKLRTFEMDGDTDGDTDEGADGGTDGDDESY